jgi:hypothetical protein
MIKKSGFYTVLFLLAIVFALTGFNEIAEAGRGDGPIVYVYGQNLYYDSIVTAKLPPQGPFQLLEMDGPPPNGLQTEFGPGDKGYVGGRWWVDGNSNGEMDDPDEGEDMYFSCPLLGPGRETP